MTLTKDDVVNSLRTFKSRRDDALHEDVATFDHHFERFVQFCDSDPLAQSVLASLPQPTVELQDWWAAATAYREPKLSFPPNSDQELALRLELIRSALTNSNHIFQLGYAHDQMKTQDAVEVFRTLILRPFAEELTTRLGAASDLATPEARVLQAVPLSRIPSPKEVKIFLSHRSLDKPLVYRYYTALKSLGFDPWLDEPEMPAGANLERELLRGFQQSCAAVFFVTENFADERYLSTEVDYAIIEKRRKGKKFAIITLRFSKSSPVPELLSPYIFKDVMNDLEGFEALIRALPSELGPVRWTVDVC
jgi:hypothetical protein